MLKLKHSFGGPEGDRTLDLLNAIQARSQLRHGPIAFYIIAWPFEEIKPFFKKKKNFLIFRLFAPIPL